MEETNKRTGLFADLSLLLVAIIWGSTFVVVKNALEHVTPMYMIAIRFGISSILMILVFFKRFKKTKWSDVKAGFTIGIFLFVAYMAQTIGLQYTTAGKQAFITGTNVVMVPFLYWAINKTRPDKYEIISAFLCFLGIGFLTFERNLSMGLGDGLTLLCALFFASHIVSIGYFAEKHDPVLLTIYQFLLTAILSFISASIFEPKITGFTKEAIFPILYLAVFGTLVAYFIQNMAQKYTKSTHAAIILSMEAVFGSLFSVLILKEPFTLKFFIGCSAILISIITAETKWDFLKRE
ncbi:MAG: DMT family transporter [Clostridiaceae bacterium]|nr:DMT family transporter [Clostridiaceae bacterium]MBW4860925.1 DMT family transporter [Clostridiaceae bacterium]MBW4867550.1 DMT family transporter [Clostridiaceae bacterium]